MIAATFATHSLPASEQLEAWRGWYGSVVDMTSPQPATEGFRARATATWTLAGVAFSRASTPPIAIAPDASPHTSQPGRPLERQSLGKRSGTDLKFSPATCCSKAPARVPFVVSLGRETYQERERDRLQLYLARDSFQAIAPLLDAVRETALDTPEGKLFADYMLLLERNLPHLPATDGPKLAAAIQAMLGACLAPSADRVAEASRHIDLTLMERVRQAVRRNLRSPSLGPDKLCREAATSRSQLYRLLEGEGGVAHYIQRRRLSESYSMLCDVSENFPDRQGRRDAVLCRWLELQPGVSAGIRHEFERRASPLSRPACRDDVTKLPAGAGVHNFGECLRSL